MTEPTCRYCGAVMKLTVEPYKGYYLCHNCRSRSPEADYLDVVELLAHQLRPIQKPMTHDELIKHLSMMHPNEIAPLYIEFREEHDYDLDFASRWRDAYNLSAINAGQGEKYGKTWRCWRARPTDEELKAAKWEGDHGT